MPPLQHRPALTYQGVQTSLLPMLMADVDVSLRYLDILGSVTYSRHKYVLEKLSASNVGHHHSRMCVVAVNISYMANSNLGSAFLQRGLYW